MKSSISLRWISKNRVPFNSKVHSPIYSKCFSKLNTSAWRSHSGSMRLWRDNGPTSIMNGSGRSSLHTLSGASLREMADLEERLWSEVGSRVQDPLLKKDLKSLKWMHRRLAVSNDNTVQILLKLPTLLHPLLDELKKLVKSAAESELQSWLSERGLNVQSKVNVEAVHEKVEINDGEGRNEFLANLGPGLSNVRHFLAVYSCKGGVGKSTVAVNLAYELARMGGRVGLLDVDIYGPSLPILVQPDDPAVRRSPLGSGMVYPIEHRGVKLLSLGFVSPNSGVPGSGKEGGATVVKGPMAGKIVAQLLKGTDWGDLDILLLDLPPGTGDVQLAVCQDLQLCGAVAVTTPSKLAIADARKGIEMFSTLGVPTVALVENMSYFECEGGGKHYPFGTGIHGLLKDDHAHLDMNVDNICRLPISTLANEANDFGSPLSLTRPVEGEIELKAFESLAKMVSKELFLLAYGQSPEKQLHYVSFEGKSGERFDLSTTELATEANEKLISFVVRIFSDASALQVRVDPSELRRRDPKTGDTIGSTKENQGAQTSTGGMVTFHPASVKSIPDALSPQSVEKKGKYGYAVRWKDGATIIYSNLAIAKSAGATLSC